MPFFKPVISGLLALILFVGLWGGTALWLPPYILPGPVALCRLLPDLWGPELKQDLWVTGARAMAGFAAAFVLGTGLGLCSAALKASMVMETLLMLVQVIPGLVLGIIFLVVFGAGDIVPVCMVVVLSVPLTAVHTANALKRINPVLSDVVQVFNNHPGRRVLDLYLPMLVPALKSNAALGMVMSVKITLLGEFLAADNGLGHRLSAAMACFDMAEVMACLSVVFGGLALFQTGLNIFCALCLKRFFYSGG